MYIVIGLGRTGLSLVRYLEQTGKPILVADTREHPANLKIFQQKFPHIPLCLGDLPRQQMLEAEAVITSPGLALDDPIFSELKRKNIPIWGDIEVFAQNALAPAVGITGANGKSTVTSLVGAMFKQANLKTYVGGNIGVPALDLLTHSSEAECYVLELSSFQLELTYSLKLQVGALLNISRDHLDRHGTLENYIAAKQRIYDHAEYAVYNRHDPYTKPKQAVPHSVTFGFDEPEPGHFGLRTLEGQEWICFGHDKVMPALDVKLFGRHNLLNALSALSIGHAAGLAFEPMCVALKEFKDLKHRCQVVKTLNNVVWINDSKGTNVGATEAALLSVGKAIGGKIILIAGGKAKDTNFSELQPLVKDYVRHLLLIGKDAQLLKEALEGSTTCSIVETLDRAVIRAAELAQEKDAVLLSPACTSLDSYSNFEERGDAFIQAVHELGV